MISYVKANSVNNWLKNEIDNILNTYKNESITKVERYSIIEDSINRNLYYILICFSRNIIY